MRTRIYKKYIQLHRLEIIINRDVKRTLKQFRWLKAADCTLYLHTHTHFMCNIFKNTSWKTKQNQTLPPSTVGISMVALCCAHIMMLKFIGKLRYYVCYNRYKNIDSLWTLTGLKTKFIEDTRMCVCTCVVCIVRIYLFYGYSYRILLLFYIWY